MPEFEESKFNAVPLAEGVHWIGVLDGHIRIFDILFPTSGTTYNSYLVRGRDKTALIDTVKNHFKEEFFSRMRSLVDPADVDYIVVNHTELDHSGSLREMLELAPRAKVIISKGGRSFLKEILNEDVSPMVVDDGDSVDLGGRTLEFFSAPWLHWPDTMFTYLPQESILFPCDAFGSHYCPPHEEMMFNDLAPDFGHEFKQYYDALVRPFKEFVLQAVGKLEGKEVKVIAPSHGPILRDNPARYVESYVEWSTPVERGPNALVFYAAAYGNTRLLAHEIAAGLEDVGVTAKLYDAVSVRPEEMLDQVEAADALLFGSPTINRDAVKPIWDILSGLATLKVRGKVAASFGSFGWSGEAVKMLDERLRSLRLKVPFDGIRERLVPDDAALARAREFGRSLGEVIRKGDAEGD